MKTFLNRWLGTGAGILLGLILAVAGVGKIVTGSERLTTIFNPFPPFLASAFSDIIMNWLPYLEVVIGLLLITGVVPRLAGVISVVLIAGFITNNSWLISHGLGYEPCSCFGVLDRMLGVNLSTNESLYLDIFILALALTAIFGIKSRFLATRPWFLTRREA